MAKVTVKKGDTLSAIAKANNTTVAKIAAANPQIANVNKINVGQKITIPTATAVKDTSPASVAIQAQAMITKLEARLKEIETSNAATITENAAAQAAIDKELSDQFAANEILAKDLGRTYDPNTGKIGALITGETKTTVTKTRAEYDAEQAALAEEQRLANQRKDAFAEIEATIKSYGFNETEMEEVNKYISGALINPKIGPMQALLDMRELNAYKTRFAGNELLSKNGLNRISEADYLQQEDDYGRKLNEYGVGSLGNRTQFATLIGNRVSVTEVGKRAALAVDQVKNADPNIMTTLKRFYSGITDADLVGYFLNPTQLLPELERKVLTGEIGAASKEYGLNDLSLARAQEFASLGIDQAGARAGYEKISEKLPRGAQLSAIAPEDQIVYNQALAEDATLKGLASAKRAEENIKNKEVARFLGSSGAAPGAFSTNYLKKSSAAGQI